MFRMKLPKYKITFLLITLIIAVGMVGCGASNRSEESTYDSASASQQMEQEAVGGFMDTDNADKSSNLEEDGNRGTDVNTGNSRKVIKSAYIEMETKVFDQAIDEIVRRTFIAGGYVESSNLTGKRISSQGSSENRRANFKLRIPQNGFEDFILEFGNIGNVILSRNGGDDITFRYFDTEARLRTLEIQEDRLLEILKKAEKVEDIIELERELSNIRYEIENLTGTLNKWDDLINYATLDVQVYEVEEIKEIKEKPTTLWQRIQNSFNSSIDALVELVKGLLILIAALAPFIVIIVPIVIVIIYIYRRTKNQNDKKL